MQSEMPFYECAEAALTASVQAVGGAKVVGSLLWPDKSVEQAHKLLLDCLNSDRLEKLSYSQIIMVFRIAKEAGFHAGFDWWAQQCEYECQPITKAEQTDRLVTVVEQSSKTLAAAVAALERIQRTNIKAAS